jgi:hypothetical protein
MDDLTSGLATPIAEPLGRRRNKESFSLQTLQSARLSVPRRIFRKLVHFFLYHFILKLPRTTVTQVVGLKLTVRPTVFHPRIFLTSKFFATFIQGLNLSDKRVADIGTGSGTVGRQSRRTERFGFGYQPRRGGDRRLQCRSKWSGGSCRGASIEFVFGGGIGRKVRRNHIEPTLVPG